MVATVGTNAVVVYGATSEMLTPAGYPLGSLFVAEDTGLEYSVGTDGNWFPRSQLSQDDEDNTAMKIVVREGARDVKEPHRRFRSGITNIWPGNENFSVTFSVPENVRRYRVAVLGGVNGEYVKVAEDAMIEEVAEQLLQDAVSSIASDVEYDTYYTSTPASGQNFKLNWSNYKELSKSDLDQPLRSLHFLGSSAGPFTILIDGE